MVSPTVLPRQSKFNWREFLGPDPNAPKPILLGLARIYRGLGVSALRSVTTHGLLWTFFDLTSAYIDGLPRANEKVI